MVDRVFCLLLFLSPIAYGMGVSFDKFDVRFFEGGIIALFVASLFDKQKRTISKKIGLPIALLFGLIILNSFWHKFQPQDIRAVETLFFGIIGFVIVVRYLANPRVCYKYMFWALGINIAILLFQKIGYTPIVSFAHYGSYIGCEGGMLGDVARFSIYLALIIPFMPLVAAIILAVLFGLILPYPQISVLIPVALMVFFMVKDKAWRISIVIAGAIISVTIFSILHTKILYSVATRWQIWKPTLAMILERPLIGWGFGTYQLWMGTESFNSYFPFIYGVGLLGAVCWLGYVIKTFIKYFNASREDVAVLSLLCLSLIEYPFEIPRLWFTIIAVLSFYAIKKWG